MRFGFLHFFIGMLTLLLVACAPPGNSRRADIGGPLSADYLQIVSVEPGLVEVDSAGRTVRAVAPDGFCIPVNSIQTSSDAVFLVMGECGGGGAPNGVISLSISNTPMTGGIDQLERFVTSPAGVVGLGYGGDAEDVSLLNVSRDRGALITMVEDRSEFGPAFAGDTICRTFLELNGRLAVLTILTDRNNGPAEADLRTLASRMAAELMRENS